MPPSIIWALSIIDDFFMPPRVIWALSIIKDFWHLPPSVGYDPSQGYFQKNTTRLKRGLQGIFLEFVKELSKMAFLHFKRMQLESTSFAFSHANMQNDFSLFMQSELSFEVIPWCLGCLSGFL
jgi:hypothetical protein